MYNVQPYMLRYTDIHNIAHTAAAHRTENSLLCIYKYTIERNLTMAKQAAVARAVF